MNSIVIGYKPFCVFVFVGGVDLKCPVSCIVEGDTVEKLAHRLLLTVGVPDPGRNDSSEINGRIQASVHDFFPPVHHKLYIVLHVRVHVVEVIQSPQSVQVLEVLPQEPPVQWAVFFLQALVEWQ